MDIKDDNSIPSTNFENISPETVSKSQTIPNLTPISKELEIEEILDHKRGADTMKRKLEIFVKWKGFDTPSWEPIQVIKDYYPTTLAKYAKDKGIESQPDWKWTKKYLNFNKVTQDKLIKLYAKKTKHKMLQDATY